MPVIEIEHASVALDGRLVLDRVDTSVDEGEFVAVLGANGSGKSTLVRAALGLVPTSGGRVRLFGQALPGFGSWHRVGFVPQRAGAASGVPSTVREVVASGRLSRRRPMRPPSRADRRAVSSALDAVGLGDQARRAISTLSGGQQQRALIARALAGEPELLVLDEPTAGVDLHHQQALATTLATLAGRGATVVLVAHELGPMRPLVGRAVLMREGRVAHDGPPPAEYAGSGGAAEHLRDQPVAHHHPARPATDHAPGVSSPLDHVRERRADR